MNIHIQQQNGMLIYHMDQWAGKVVVLNPTAYDSNLLRSVLSENDNLANTNVYILVGEDKNGTKAIYIGKTDNCITHRWEAHQKLKKDDEYTYTQAVVISSRTSFFSAYLEARIYGDIKTRIVSQKNAFTEDEKTGNVIVITNVQKPSIPKLDPSYAAVNEQFYNDWLKLRGFLTCLNEVLDLSSSNVDIIENKKAENPQNAHEENQIIFELKGKDGLYNARMKEYNGQFLVLKGSKCRKEWQKNMEDKYRKPYKIQRNEMEIKGILVESGKSLIFQEDYAFSSLSAAAMVIQATSADGKEAWKTCVDNEMVSYKDFIDGKKQQTKSEK